MSKTAREPGTFREVKVAPRARKTKIQIKVVNDVDIRWGVSIPDVISRLTTAAAGLDDATLEVDSYEEYGSQTITTNVEGWRDATAQEVEDKRDYEKWQREERNRFLERQAEQMKRERPDLFK